MDKLDRATTRLKAELATLRLWEAACRLRLALKYNPNWPHQPRIPAGVPEGGQWTFGQLVAALPLVLLRQVAPIAVRLLRERARSLAPLMRRLPKRWNELEGFPVNDDFDHMTERIGPPSAHRPGSPLIRFNSARELREFLGSAGPYDHWHHIVEQRLAGWRFPVELIHSTDNIVSLPIEVHRRINAIMSQRSDAYGGVTRREWIEDKTFGEQYNLGLQLVEKVAKEMGYDYARY